MFENGVVQICPNLTSGVKIDQASAFYAEAVRCGTATEDSYASGIECSSDIEVPTFYFNVRTVKTNFDPDVYAATHKL